MIKLVQFDFIYHFLYVNASFKMLIKRSNRTSEYYTVCLLCIGKSKLQSNFAFTVNSTHNAGI